MNVRFEELMAQVRLAKQLGFTGIAKSCHYSSSPWQEIQQIPFLARAAAEAPGLNFITSIVLLPLHKPLEIAEQTAALDLFTGGRFILGVGIGYRDVEFKAFGTSREERVPRLVENIQAIRRLWTEDAVTMKGSHFELDGAVCSLKPRRPPPIWIGANADPAIRRAAHIADSWMINPHNRIDTILRQIEVYKRGLDEAGKPWPETLPLAREMFVARTRDEAIRLARPYLEAKYKAYHDWGQGDAMPEGDNDLGQEFDELARDRFLFGSADEVAEQIIGMMKATGANQLSCPIQWPGMPHEVVVEQMHVMAEEVVPLVKQGL